jgi:subtilisin family serine protease
MSDRRVARRVEIRLPSGQRFPKLEELSDLGDQMEVKVVERDRREHVRRLDLELVGRMRDVARVVEALERNGAQVMRDEVLPAPDAPDGRVYPDPEVQGRIAAPEEPVAGERPTFLAPTKPVIVAIIDSGIMTAHPDLLGHLWSDPKNLDAHGFNVIGPNKADIEDEDGHGTMLAGTVLAGANRSLAVRLMTVKLFDGRTRPESDLGAAAIDLAVDQGAHILNLSWAVGVETPGLRQAIEYAGEKGVLVVVAAGNSGADNDSHPTFPASYGRDLPNVITVMATDLFDDKAGFSNYGKDSVHIAAPGVRVTSTHPYATREPGDLEKYQRFDGTSASAAYVAGAAALLKSVCPNLPLKDLKDCLINTADPSRDPRSEAKGRLNLDKARAAAEAHCQALAAARG